MTKQKLFSYFVAAFILLIAVMTLPFQVGPAAGEGAFQTWPSRTPTPQGGPQPTVTNPPPTSDPGGGGDGGPANTPPPGVTNTPVTGQSPTPTSSATIIIPTPIGGYEATALPCGVPPTVQALGLVNVRLGPGVDYEPVSSMVYLEVRPIIGRAEFANWWLIQLPGNDSGWVSDQAVVVRGYTGLVPIVDPPAIDGATPTPGPLWQPTPNPVCTPLPTPTPTLTPTVEVAEVSVANTSPTEAPPEPSNTPTDEPTEPAASDTLEPTVAATVTVAPTATTNTGSPITEEASANDNNDDSPTSASSWILFIGIGLVVVAGATYVLRNR